MGPKHPRGKTSDSPVYGTPFYILGRDYRWSETTEHKGAKGNHASSRGKVVWQGLNISGGKRSGKGTTPRASKAVLAAASNVRRPIGQLAGSKTSRPENSPALECWVKERRIAESRRDGRIVAVLSSQRDWMRVCGRGSQCSSTGLFSPCPERDNGSAL